MITARVYLCSRCHNEVPSDQVETIVPGSAAAVVALPAAVICGKCGGPMSVRGAKPIVETE